MLGLDWTYVKRRVELEEFPSTLSSLDNSWRGLSLTMPLKHAGFLASSTVDSHGTYTQAVNTLSFAYVDGFRVVRGFNTDVFGITASLRAAGLTSCTQATIVGGGATALSALVALDELGAQRVSIVLRDTSKSESLTALAATLGIEVSVFHLDDANQRPASDAVISTVPGSANVSLDTVQRKSGALLLDVAYDDWPSPRAQEWTRRGGVAVSGLSMLAYQAIKQVRIFTAGVPDQELAREGDVAAAMFASVGLNAQGL